MQLNYVVDNRDLNVRDLLFECLGFFNVLYEPRRRKPIHGVSDQVQHRLMTYFFTSL